MLSITGIKTDIFNSSNIGLKFEWESPLAILEIWPSLAALVMLTCWYPILSGIKYHHKSCESLFYENNHYLMTTKFSVYFTQNNTLYSTQKAVYPFTSFCLPLISANHLRQALEDMKIPLLLPAELCTQAY